MFRPRQLCPSFVSPLRKVQTRLLQQKQSRCALNLTAFNAMEANENLDTHVVYESLEGVERLENYRPGGYHPIHIGDYFQGRYRVVDKLGHGCYSTAWLARDETCDKYVAVKVCTGNANPIEFDIISTLTRPDPPVNHPGKMMVPTILDRFTIHGPNGNHACYVTAPGSASLSGAKDG